MTNQQRPGRLAVASSLLLGALLFGACLPPFPLSPAARSRRAASTHAREAQERRANSTSQQSPALAESPAFKAGNRQPNVRLVQHTVPLAPTKADPWRPSGQQGAAEFHRIARAGSAGAPAASPGRAAPCDSCLDAALLHVESRREPGVVEIQGCGGSERTRVLRGVEDDGYCREPQWDDAKPLPWEIFGPGEYIGPVRTAPVTTYRLRVNDLLNFTYYLSREEIDAYRLQIGDKIRVDSRTESAIARSVEVMPDGRVSLHSLGYVHVAGMTIPELTDLLEHLYRRKAGLRKPGIFVTGEEVNTRLRDIQSTVQGNISQQGGNRGIGSIGAGGITQTINPDGKINLVGLRAPVCCQGLSVMELQHEINARYREEAPGLTVNVSLQNMAPKSVFVLGEVARPGRHELQGPTRVTQALALAGGATLAGNQREIVMVRHTPQWGAIATKLDLRGFLIGKRPLPSDDLWVRDQDIIMVPRGPIQRINDMISMLFTNGAYAVAPELGGFSDNVYGIGTVLGN